MISYFVQSTVILSLFYLAYKLFFERNANFQHNRFYLLCGIFISFLIPLLPLNFSPEKIEYLYLSRDVFETPTVSNAASNPTTEVLETPFWYFIYTINPIVAVYVTGVLVSLFLMFLQLKRIYNIIGKGQSVRKDGMKLVFTNEPVSPFSFFNTIVLNPKMLNEKQIEHILIHENIHIGHWHQIDVLLAETLNIGLWFFPLTRYYGKAMRTNLEFIADAYSLKNGIDKKEYQLNLISLSQQSSDSVLVNNFSKKIIKNRIKMLNKMKTNSKTPLIFRLSIPLMVLISFIVSVKAQSQGGKVKQVIVLSEDGINPDEVKVMTQNENGEFVPLDQDMIMVVTPDDLNEEKKSDTVLIPGEKLNLNTDGLKKIITHSNGFSVSVTHTDSISKEQMMILKDKFNIKSDTLIITKNGVFSNKDFKFPDGKEWNQKNFENYFPNGQQWNQKELEKNFPKAQPLPELNGLLIPKNPQSPDYSGYPKLLENWEGGVYSKSNVKIYEPDENGILQLKGDLPQIDPGLLKFKENNAKGSSKTKIHQNSKEGVYGIPAQAFKNGKTPKIFIDGKLSTMKELEKAVKAQSHKIEFITSNDEANIKKYGKEVKTGVLVATKLNKMPVKTFGKAVKPEEVTRHAYQQRAQNDFDKTLIPEIAFQNGRNPKIFINGKISGMEQLKEIEAANTHEIVFLVSDNAKEINTYGPDVKSGIIIATPKTGK